MTHRATPTRSGSSTRTSHRRMNRRQALPKPCDAPRCAMTVFLVSRRSSLLRGIAIPMIQSAPWGKGFVRRRRRGNASSGKGPLGSPGSTPVSTKHSDRWNVVYSIPKRRWRWHSWHGLCARFSSWTRNHLSVPTRIRPLSPQIDQPLEVTMTLGRELRAMSLRLMAQGGLRVSRNTVRWRSAAAPSSPSSICRSRRPLIAGYGQSFSI